MKKILLHSLGCLALVFVVASSSIKTKIIGNNVKYYTIDKLNQIYTIEKDNSIHKYDANGNLLIAKNLKTEGDIDLIDARNVFDILLFYKSINTVLSTDNLFTKRYTLSYNEKGAQVSAIARSFDNHIWAYDMISQRLLKTDILGKELIASSSLSSQSNSHQFYQIIESVPYVFLIDSSSIVTMNIYGKMIDEKKLNQKIEHSFLYQDTLWLQCQNQLKFVTAKTPKDSIQNHGYLPNNQTIHLLSKGQLNLKSDTLFLQTN